MDIARSTLIGLLLLTFAGCGGNRAADPPMTAPQPVPTERTAQPPEPRPGPPAERVAAPPRVAVAAPTSTAEVPAPAPPPAKPLPAPSAPAPEPAPEPEPTPQDPDEDAARLPRYLKVLQSRPGSAALLPDASTEGARTVRIRSNDATVLRITRNGLPLTTRGSIVLRIDSQVFEWTPQHRTLDLGFSPSSGWSIIARDGSPP